MTRLPPNVARACGRDAARREGPGAPWCAVLLAAAVLLTGCEGAVGSFDPDGGDGGGGGDAGGAGGAGGGVAGGGAGGGAAGGGAGGGAAGGGAGGGAAGGGAGGGSVVPSDGGAYGVPVGGYPTWRERAILTVTNAARMTPAEYRVSAFYSTPFNPSLAVTGVMESRYPAQPPFWYHVDLGRAARQHSQEMADRNYFSHNSVDGGSPFTRIRSYYTLSSTVGENIAAGNSDPVRTVHQWLCDRTTSDAGTSICCLDGQACDGHRRGIMNANFRALGTGYGYASTATYGHYWTQDFGGAAVPPYPPLTDGAHLLPTGATRFVANVSAGAAVQSVSVVVDGVSSAMALELGTASRGTWFVSMGRAAGCRSYHFEAVDGAGVLWRYPAQGEFRTREEGGCAEEYVP